MAYDDGEEDAQEVREILGSISDVLKAQQRDGFDAKHDDQHTDKSILRCGVYLAADVLNPIAAPIAEASRGDMLKRDGLNTWPVNVAGKLREKYANDEVQRLHIAAAMIVAEIRRRLRESNAAAR